MPEGRRSTDRLLPVLTVLGCLVAWQAAVAVFAVPVYLLPPPGAIVMKTVSSFALLFEASLATVGAITAGFLLAVAVGIPTATGMVYWQRFERAVYPVLVTAQVLPKVALAPLFIVWFGFGTLPKVLMTFLISFFPIVIDTVTGLSGVRPESLMLVRSMGGSRWQSFWKIRLPNALPSIFGGLKVAITFAVVGTIVAEFVGSDSGLGYVLVVARGNLDTVTVFTVIAWLVAIGFLYYVAVELAEVLLVKGRSKRRVRELGAGL